ncbi:RNA-splicing factor [Tilletia horrida]|uniref:Pre-mRNA-splicing factor CWC24 n=1 Tax=Tilletia horrida TaxID=155126 RepID=A0AAN6GCN3_9BASI|nr:RNA-splicing factor [Tilletia horrida]KAK0563353.1 RNA-splicing factor [Tilletia horrida]
MADPATPAEAGASDAPVFKKKAPRNRDVRARPAAEASGASSSSGATGAYDAEGSRAAAAEHHPGGGGEEDEEPARSEVVLKRKAPSMSNPLVQRTAGAVSLANKRQRLGSDEDDDEYASIGAVDRFGERTVHSSSALRRGGDGGDAPSSRDKARDDATRGRNWNGADGDEEDDAPGSSSLKLSKDDPEAVDDGLYRGLSAYKSHAPAVRDDGSSSKVRAKGPIKPTANIRTISVVDYQPDVCKDYKETGYCGFGDTCKFLHDRSDYLAGWQLALVPEAYSGGKRRDDVSLGVLEGGGELDEEDEEIPFACLICRQPFTEPVVTRCGHYFCMACAIKRYAKNPKCFACGKPTNGIFNAATKIIERMEKKREAKAESLRERRKAWGQEGEEQNSGEILDGVEIG